MLWDSVPLQGGLQTGTGAEATPVNSPRSSHSIEFVGSYQIFATENSRTRLKNETMEFKLKKLSFSSLFSGLSAICYF